MKAIALAALLTAAALPAQAVTLDFEGFAGPPLQALTGPISTGGYTLQPLVGTFNTYSAGAVTGVPESGSTSVLIGRSPATPVPGGASFTLTRDGGLAFSLASLRASEGRNAGSFSRFGSDGITVLGTLIGGGTISQVLTFDGIASDNPATDFQTFALAGFGAVSAVQFTAFGRQDGGYSFGFDDIVVGEAVAPIPLPAGLPLLLAGLCGLALLRRRRA